ncbi:MAG: glycosyltransferase family 4 protein [Hyphomicrobiales bacterium]|nr:glycosyltransferase family 4 protein [Hyphomicrobiales bacterium]
MNDARRAATARELAAEADAVLYDVTRIATRFFRSTPNGIDRVDLAYARHFLGRAEDSGFDRGVIWTPLGARTFSGARGARLVDDVLAHWGETRAADGNLFDRPTGRPRPARRAGEFLRGVSAVSKSIPRAIAPSPPAAKRHGGGFYFNASQFPIWRREHRAWVARQTGLRSVFFVHDLLPITHPEFFPAAEPARHLTRMEAIADSASGVVVASEHVRDDLARHFRGLGRAAPPVCVAPLPVSETFVNSPPRIGISGGAPFFLVCGTVEPRKNHLLLLNVWRELIRREAHSAPKLIVAGRRGGGCDNTAALLDRATELRGHVITIPDATTPEVCALMDRAQAVLMPSFAEGFGFPVHEAVARGTPVLASDIPAFRGLSGSPLVTLIDPVDGAGWLEAVRARAGVRGRKRGAREIRTTWEGHFREVEGFLASL